MCIEQACDASTHVLRSDAGILHCAGTTCTIDDQDTCCQVTGEPSQWQKISEAEARDIALAVANHSNRSDVWLPEEHLPDNAFETHISATRHSQQICIPW